MKRIIAANLVMDSNGEAITPGVVELEEDIVCRVYALDGEQPFTEWIGGTIIIKCSTDGLRRAYKDNVMLTSRIIL